MPRFIFIILIGLLLSSCMPPRVTPQKLYDHYQAHMLDKFNQMQYMGSKGKYHYFHHARISMMKREYRVLKDELPIDDEFPLTDDQETWRAYRVVAIDTSPPGIFIILKPYGVDPKMIGEI